MLSEEQVGAGKSLNNSNFNDNPPKLPTGVVRAAEQHCSFEYFR